MRRLRLAFCVALSAAVPPACSSDTTADRKCTDSIAAYRISEDQTCGELVTLSISVCQRETQSPSQCKQAKGTNLYCLASPGNHGFLLVLDPCADLDGAPDGWVLPENSGSGEPQFECDKEAFPCGGGAGGSGGGAGG